MRAFAPELLGWEGRLRSGWALRVDDSGAVVDAVPAAQVEGAVRLPGQALLPGLVNAHSHAFQRLLRGRTEYAARGQGRDDFWSWRDLMYRAAAALTPEGLYRASRQAFVEMALSGITTVGEFHYLHHGPDGTPYEDVNELARQVIRAAREVGLRIVLLRVGYARSGFEVAPEPRQRRFIDPSVDRFLEAARSLRSAVSGDPKVTVGLAPHSVRAVPRAWLEEVARVEEGVVHLHVAEQPAELDACLREHGVRPLRLLDEVGLLTERFTGVHGVHVTEEEVALFAKAGATVCACPSTERNLGDGVIPADAWRAAGVPVALGSDSQANVDLLDDARQLELHLRLVRQRRAVLDAGDGTVDGLGAWLFGCATLSGARSLGLEAGALRPGAAADFFTVDLAHPSLVGARPEELMPALVFGGSAGAVREVYVGGERVVAEGRHPLAEESGRAFTGVVKEVFG